MEKVILYIHGKNGSYMEVEQYKKNCMGFDMVGIDYQDDVPWVVRDQIRAAYDKACERYNHIYIIANSIGAYFAMHALQDTLISRQTVDMFVSSHHAALTVMENGEHWFHTDKQLAFLDGWMKRVIC